MIYLKYAARATVPHPLCKGAAEVLGGYVGVPFVFIIRATEAEFLQRMLEGAYAAQLIHISPGLVRPEVVLILRVYEAGFLERAAEGAYAA